MKRLWENENGLTLIELVVVIILIGVALPSILSMMGLVSLHSVRNEVTEEAVSLAESKMEEIIGKKETRWDWYKDASQFEADETLPDGYQRVVEVTPVTGWGNAELDAWEIKVTVSHQLLPDGYSLVTRLTKYH